MADRSYNIAASVTGREEVAGLAEDIATIDEAASGLGDKTISVDVESTGVTETAEGLDKISENTEAAGVLEGVGGAADDAAPKVEGVGGAFKEMFSAISLVQIASFGLDFVMGKLAEKAERIKQQEAFDAAQVEVFADALREAGDEATNLVDALEGEGDIVGSFWGEEFNITNDLAEANISADQFFRTLQTDGRAGYDTIIQAAQEAGLSEEAVGRIRIVGATTLENLGIAAEGAAAANEVFAETQTSANEALQSLLDEQDPMRRFSDEWALLGESISDGSLDTTAASDALNTLANGLNLTTDEVLALAQAELNEGAAGARAYSDAIGSIDFQNTDIQGATTAFSAFTTGLFAGENQAQAAEAAYANMVAAVGDGAFTLDVATEAGRAQQDALEGVAGVLDGQLAQAYDAANGSQSAFVASATQLGEGTLSRLQSELGLTDTQVDGLRTTLGLTATDYEARFELAGAAEAQLQLGLLQGAITGLPPDVELVVNTLITQGDYVGARDAIASYYAGTPVEAPVVPDTTGFLEGVVGAVAGIGPATVTTGADTAPMSEQIIAASGGLPPATITADADTAAAATDLLNEAAKFRAATILAVAQTSLAGSTLDQVSKPRKAIITGDAKTVQAKSDLDGVASKQRTATITGRALTGTAESQLNYLARGRTATISVRTVGGVTSGVTSGGGGAFGAYATAPTSGARGFGAGPGFGAVTPRGLDAPSGASSGGGGGVIVINDERPNLTVNMRGVIGNTFEMRRNVAKGQAEYTRIHGTRGR